MEKTKSNQNSSGVTSSYDPTTKTGYVNIPDSTTTPTTTPTPTPTIDLATVNSTEKPMNMPPPATTPNYIQNFNTASPEVSALDAERQRISKEKIKSESDIFNLIKDMGVVSGKESQYANDFGANVLDERIRNIDVRMMREDRALKNYKDQTFNDPNFTKGLASNMANEAERRSASYVADLSIEKSVLSGDYEAAKQTAKDKVAMELAPMKAELEAKKYIYENNKDLFNKAEASKLDGLIKADEKRLEEEADTKKTVENMKLQALANNAPKSVISALANAKTVNEAITAGGKYGVDYLTNEIKRANLSKTYTEIDKLKKEMAGTNIDQATIDSTVPKTGAGFTTKLLSTSGKDKQLESSERLSLSKAMTVVGQLDSLQSNIAGQNKTGFFKGKVNNFLASIGQNADVGTINAQLQAIIPNLARGIYGEVGVLTNSDVENYKKTVPNLTSPKDQNDAVLALTLKTVKNSIENQLSAAANSGVNVSGWAQDYNRISNQINEIENRIGISKTAVNDLIAKDPSLLPIIKEMYQAGATDGDILEALNAQ